MGADRVRERRPRTRPEGSRGGPGDGAAVLRRGVRSLGAINCRALPTVQLATGEAGSAAWERPSTKAGSDRARDSKEPAGGDRAGAATRRGARPPGEGMGGPWSREGREVLQEAPEAHKGPKQGSRTGGGPWGQSTRGCGGSEWGSWGRAQG